MSCPTCEATMASVIEQILWCPRCGTLKDEALTDDISSEAPALVRRAREVIQNDSVVALVALAEACLPPAERPHYKPRRSASLIATSNGVVWTAPGEGLMTEAEARAKGYELQYSLLDRGD